MLLFHLNSLYTLFFFNHIYVHSVFLYINLVFFKKFRKICFYLFLLANGFSLTVTFFRACTDAVPCSTVYVQAVESYTEYVSLCHMETFPKHCIKVCVKKKPKAKQNLLS